MGKAIGGAAGTTLRDQRAPSVRASKKTMNNNASVTMSSSSPPQKKQQFFPGSHPSLRPGKNRLDGPQGHPLLEANAWATRAKYPGAGCQREGLCGWTR